MEFNNFGKGNSKSFKIVEIRVISKVSLVIHRVRLLKKNLAKRYISIQWGMKLLKLSILVVNGVSSCLFFFLSASTAAAYIFSALNCTTTIISLGPRPLSAEFQHFILRFNKMSLLCGYQGTGGERRPKDRVKTGLFYG
jgi:hypothetical protein